jgi:large subunit ribosomal protein L23
MALFKKDTKKEKSTPAKTASMKDMYADAPSVKDTEKKSSAKAMAVSNAYRILLRPVISEKASHQQTLANQYFFEVAIGANKIEIAKAVKAAYGIMPSDVNVIRMEGKSRRYGRKIGKRKDWKKAIVTLPKGKSITLYEGV